MPARRSLLSLAAVTVFAFCAGPALAQEVVVDGPPPALRKNLDAFVKGVNGAPDAFEAMAKTTYTPEFLKRQTANERKAAYLKMRADFGTIQITKVERRGPEAPLQAFVKGSVASGVIWIDLDESSRIAGLRTVMDKKSPGPGSDAHRHH